MLERDGLYGLLCVSIASWCNGSTRDSGSLCLGSNPSEAAKPSQNIPRRFSQNTRTQKAFPVPQTPLEFDLLLLLGDHRSLFFDFLMFFQELRRALVVDRLPPAAASGSCAVDASASYVYLPCP